MPIEVAGIGGMPPDRGDPCARDRRVGSQDTRAGPQDTRAIPRVLGVGMRASGEM